MKLLQRTFVELTEDALGHVSSYRRNNGNTYYVFYIECRYAGFQEISADGLSIVDSDGAKPFEDFAVFATQSYE
jgi:hypothetical protein